MALITENGTGLADAESFISVADATTYHAAMGNVAWAVLSTDKMEQCLRKGAAYMGQVYNSRWQGLRVNNTQALDWPRVGVVANNYAVLATVVPTSVQNACAELALRASAGELLADTEQQITRETIGPITTEYDKSSAQAKRYPAIDAMLRPYLDGSSSTVHRLVR
jgi:hypothetical protein